MDLLLCGWQLMVWAAISTWPVDSLRADKDTVKCNTGWMDDLNR